MTETATQNNTDNKKRAHTATPGGRPSFSRGPRPGGKPGDRGGFRGRGGPRRGGRTRERSEFAQKIIDIRRVTRVVAGGRRFSFSVVIVLGDKKGQVGVGIGKATDTALAIEKASRNAKKNMIKVKRTKTNSIPHEVKAKYCSSVVMMIPVKGKGLVAGSSLRNVLDLAGITDVSAKIMSRSKNKLNNARASIDALKQLS